MVPIEELSAFSASFASLANRAVMALGPRDEDAKHGLQINSDEKNTLIALACYAGFYLAFRLLRHFGKAFFLPKLMDHFNTLTTAFHELGHAIAVKFTCGHVEYISVNKDLGGKTQYYDGRDCIVFSAGYLMVSAIGSVLVFCGFNLAASQIIFFFLVACFILTIFWTWRDIRRGKYTVVIALAPTAFFLILFEILSAVEHNNASRVLQKYFISFLGVLFSLTSLVDILSDEIIHQKQNSDSHLLGGRDKWCAICYAWLWWILSLIFLVASVLGGITAFNNKDNSRSVFHDI